MRRAPVPEAVVRLEDYRPSDYLIPAIHLDFALDPKSTRVRATLAVRRQDRVGRNVPLHLDGDELSLDSLLVNGQPHPQKLIDVSPSGLVLRGLPAAKSFELVIETTLNPSANSKLMGLYLSNGVFCTQCEAEGFRRITYFIDRPDILTVYTVRVEADRKSCPLLLSNGNPTESGKLPKGRHYAMWHDPFPKPSYLFALVAGDLGKVADSFVTASGREVDLGIYVEHGKEARASYAMDSLKRAMRWDEERYGRQYELDVFNVVAVSDFIIGAMENTGLNIFNDKYVLSDAETATDIDFAGIEAIIAHEYFHNWTGNRITCRDWFQLCLKEGLTVFRDHEFSADQRSATVKRIAEVRALRAHQFPEDQGPLAHPVRPRRYREINNFYTATVYEKGSEIVRMLKIMLGADTYRQAMDLYFERHDGEAATIDDFLAVFAETSGRDLSQFALWYHQSGTPQINVATAYDPRERSFTIELEQALAPTRNEGRKRPMHIPLAFGLVGGNGADMDYVAADPTTVSGGIIHLRKRRQSVKLTGVSSEPALSINRGFSAPVTVVSGDDSATQAFLARHDGDGFNRWQALNGLVTQELVEAARAVRAGKSPEFSPKAISLLSDFATDPTLEPAYRALAITLPSEADIARELGDNLDPDAIHEGREAMIGTIAAGCGRELRQVFDEMQGGEAFSADAASAGRRALRNAALTFLEATPLGLELCVECYASATNMTDRLAALTALTHRFATTRQAAEALADFEARFGHDPLVMDKWFMVQASVPNADALERVQVLARHPAYAASNPNRVRALVGTYASANQVGFNRADGAGYAYLADCLIEIDAANPRLAARLATALRAWRSLETGRRALAREALSRLAARPDISVDLRDIVVRTLA
jgi:aminopeptidase N